MLQQSKELHLDLLEANLAMVQQYFKDIDDIADSIIYNQNIIRFMKSTQDGPEDLEFLAGIESLYYNSRSDLKLSFYKVNNWNNMYTIDQANQAISISDYRYTDWYQEIVWTDKKKVLLTESSEDSTEFVQSCIYKVEDIYSPYVVGYLKVDMDLKVLKERSLYGYSKLAGATIMDEEGEVLFYDKMPVIVPLEVFQEGITGTYETKEYIMIYGTAESTGWHLCMAASKNEIMKNQREMVKVLIFILAVILIVTILLSNKCCSVITVNYKRLVQGMARVKEGNLTTQVEVDKPDEIGILIYGFNDMMKQVDELVKQVESKQLLVKEAEIKALQQQINPHFMYNIMETIMGLASEGMNDAVIQVSRCVSSMLRYNTHFENITVIKEELKQIKNYITVMQIRFENRFEVFYDVDEACVNSRILKFTLQPLVENAISHGIETCVSEGMLRIRIKKEGSEVSIMIYDNGGGIEKEQLSELNKRLKATYENPLEYIDQYKSLGIMNVHLRFRLCFGEAYSMEIFSKEGHGTCIAIKIPYITNEIEKK